MDRKADKNGSVSVNPWDREIGLTDRRQCDRETAAGQAGQAAPAQDPNATRTGPAAAIDARTITPRYGTIPARVRKDPPKAVLLSAWAGILGMACGLFCTAGPWLFQDTDLSVAIWVTGILGIVLGIYAAVGAYFKMGRPDIAASGIILGTAGLLVTFVWTPGTLLLTPT